MCKYMCVMEFQRSAFGSEMLVSKWLFKSNNEKTEATSISIALVSLNQIFEQIFVD